MACGMQATRSRLLRPMTRPAQTSWFFWTSRRVLTLSLIHIWLEIHWHLPEEFAVSPANHISVSLEQYHCNIGKTQIAFEVTGYQLNRSRYDLVIEIQSVGRHTKGLIPVTPVSYTHLDVYKRQGLNADLCVQFCW